MKNKCKKSYCKLFFFLFSFLVKKEIFVWGNNYFFGGNYINPFINVVPHNGARFNQNGANNNEISGFNTDFVSQIAILENSSQFSQTVTSLGKELEAELNSIILGNNYLTTNENIDIAQNSVKIGQDATVKHESQVKSKKKIKPKSGASESKFSINSSSLIAHREYFLPVPTEVGRGVKLNESCLFSPTPLYNPRKKNFWKKTEDLKIVNCYEVSSPVTTDKIPFRTSSECLNLFDEAFIAFRKKELLISPEKFVSLTRQVGMQLRDSLINANFVVSTEDLCLAMRMMLFLPHQLRNTVNCKSAIIASLRNSEETCNFELLDQFDKHTESKFNDLSFSCKSVLKFNEPVNSFTNNQTFKPSEMAKLFRLDLTVEDLQFFHRLSIPHRKAALKVQESYKKYMKEILLYDIAASVVFLLNELHIIDQSIEQCSAIVIVCASMQNSENSKLSQITSEQICKDLGIEVNSQKHNVKYNSLILSKMLKKQTHDRLAYDSGLKTSYTLPSGKTLLPYSKLGYPKMTSNLEIWSSVGKLFSDGTISSFLIPVCTGLPAFEFNRFLFLNTMIERYLVISGLSKFKLTVEDICLIVKYYLAYKKHPRNQTGNKISPEDAIPLAIYTVTQKLNLDIFTIPACREIYREFFDEEEAELKKVTTAISYQDRLELLYSKPPFSYNSNVVLSHLPKIMINRKNYECNSWSIFQKNSACSQLKHYVLNRMVLFVAYVLEFWRKNRYSEKIPFKSITEVCDGFSGENVSFRPKVADFKLFAEDWLFQKDDITLHTTTLDSIWSNFLIFENSAFPKNTEESESEYLQRIYHNTLVPEPLFTEDWCNIELPIRMDIAEFIKLLPHVNKSVKIFSTLDQITLNHVTLIRAFLESFFEETYQFPILVSEQDIILLLERRDLEKRPMDDLFFEIMSARSDWSWIKHETSSHAILKLLEYLKTVKRSVESRIQRDATKSDIYSVPRAILTHGKWLIKSPHPIFSPPTPLQKRTLQGLPKFLMNKSRYIQAYFINAFEKVLQFDLSLQLADIVYSLTNCANDEKKLVELLTERISAQSGQNFITEKIVSEIYNSCMSFSFYRYLLKGALSEEQAFAAPRVFYKPKVGWKFFPPNVPDFSKLLVLSKVFKVESDEFHKAHHKGLDEKNSQEIVVNPYTWNILKEIHEQKKLEIWRLNRAISMCAYFNHWISFKFPFKNIKDLQVSSCINAIYRLKNTSEKHSQSEISQIFLRYIGIPFLKETDISEMLSAFNSFELIGKPNSMSSRQWLMNLYRIPQIEESNKNSLSEEFESLRLPTPPVFGEQSTLNERGQTHIMTGGSTEIPEIFIPIELDFDSLNNFRELLEKFTHRFLERVGVDLTDLEVQNFSMTDLFDKMAIDRKLSLSETLEQHISSIGVNIPGNILKKLSLAFYKFILLKFSSSNQESFEQILSRICKSRLITDSEKLPFDIPLGIISGKLDPELPYNSFSFGEMNFARLVVAYINEYFIEQFDLRSKISDNGGYQINLRKEFPGFVNENCVAKSMEIIRKGGVELEYALDQSCTSELPWINAKILRMLVSGLITYCKLNFSGFPTDRNGRKILDFSRENLNFPVVFFDKYFETWTMQNAVKNKQDGKIDSKFSTLDSVGVVDSNTGLIVSSTFNFCSEMNTSQTNRLLIKLQYYKHCISENTILNVDIDRLLDLNVWCLAFRQEIPEMKKTYSNLLFNYFGISGIARESFEVLEESFELLEESWLGKNSILSIIQRTQDFYSSHTKPFSQLNSLIKSGKLFCPRIISEEDLHQLQYIQKDNLINRVEAFQGFSEIFLRERYGIIFESRQAFVATLVNGFSKIKSSSSNKLLIKSMIPIVSEEISISLIEAFNRFETNLLKGGLSSIQDLYQNPICERLQGSWHFHVDLETISRANDSLNSRFIFSESEINRFQNIVAFLNCALNFKYSDKLLGSYISFKHVATLFQSGVDLSSFANSLNYFHRILQDDLSFSPWFTVKALKGIFQAFISWESAEIFKISTKNSKDSGLKVSSTNMSKYNNSPVGMISGKWHWYTWCRKPNFETIRREVLGDEVIHVLSTQERNIYGIPTIKHKFEVATLFIQYFLQEVLGILIPFKPDVTLEIFRGKTNLHPDSVEFLKNIWEHYKNTFVNRGFFPKHDIFYNPIINVAHKQRFFPTSGVPKFDNFDTSSIPSSLKGIENFYMGVNTGSKLEVNRLVTICVFINLSFEVFIDGSANIDEILTPLDLYPLLKDQEKVPIAEISSKVIDFIKREYPFYSNSQKKILHLKTTLLNYGNFENHMIDNGWDLSKLYQSPIAITVQNGYKMNFNLKSYLPKVAN